jgi:hypothetical protein
MTLSDGASRPPLVPLPTGAPVDLRREPPPAVPADLTEGFPLEQAIAGGTPQSVGSWRFYFADERWEWSPEVERIHGYEPGTVTPTTRLVLSHKHPDDLRHVAATLDDIRRTLTAFLFQKGSSESKPIDEAAPQDQDPRQARHDPAAPWPVRRGGIILVLYEHSLAIAFFVLFFASMALHALGGRTAYNEEQAEHGQATISVWHYLTTSQFWFESMQNWQSEFIAVAAIVGLSIFLRQRGSAESKPVAEPHRHTSA